MSQKLSLKEKAVCFETSQHILLVQKFTNKLAALLVERGRKHDRSKLESPEVEYFTKYTEELADLTYNSPEYMECLEKMRPAIDHHYANNSHHPEYFPDGIAGMSLVDICEMLGDWAASSKRQNNGNLRISLESACKRFNIEPQLASILKNTLDIFEETE